jgi:hypothetical protein
MCIRGSDPNGDARSSIGIGDVKRAVDPGSKFEKRNRRFVKPDSPRKDVPAPVKLDRDMGLHLFRPGSKGGTTSSSLIVPGKKLPLPVNLDRNGDLHLFHPGLRRP